MKRRIKRKRACRGKMRYRDEKQASIALKQVQARSTRQKVPTRSYSCEHCHGWHLSSQPVLTPGYDRATPTEETSDVEVPTDVVQVEDADGDGPTRRDPDGP